MNYPNSSTSGASVICIVGAGPTGTSILERLCANAAELTDGRPLEIHLVDPFPPGAGRVWRSAQAGLLWMNSTTADVTMFTDESVQCDGPIRPGPSLWEWITEHAPVQLVGTELAEEAQRQTAGGFASRPLLSAYLAWVFRHLVDTAPPTVRIRVHAARAVDVIDLDDGRQAVWLADDDTPIEADTVVLAQGHLDVVPGAEEVALLDFAARHGLTYVPTGYSADISTEGVAAGQDVIVRGMGLAFVDYMVLLAESRGGRFVRPAGGSLSYVPSGQEPILHIGSRRGVPYHSKTGYLLRGERPPLPRFFTVDSAQGLSVDGAPLDFRADLWPLIAKELGFAYYHELFTAHPDRVGVAWPEFERTYAELGWGSTAMTALVETAVPEPEDRLDFARLDRPLAGRTFADRDELQAGIRDYIRRDLDRRADPDHSADLAAIFALLSVYGVLAELLPTALISPASLVRDAGGWFHGFFSYVASGPPPQRLEELLALSEAGIVRFLGPDVEFTVDDQAGVFRASSPSTPGSVETAAMLEARLPSPALDRVSDPLLRRLVARGEIVADVLVDPVDGRSHPTGKVLARPSDKRLVDVLGNPHPRRFALGHWVGGGAPPTGFSRPRFNAPSFRAADVLARAALQSLTLEAYRARQHQAADRLIA